MAIDRDEILRLAALARIRVDPEEAEQLAADLRSVLGHLDVIREVIPSDADASGAWFDSDVHREDRTAEGLDREAALRNAPVEDGECFVVPRIIDKDAT
jgi:aspartyl-tRNA(Asn)/glutamyl-tRNA(Gln) amidotransferase subunit C